MQIDITILEDSLEVFNKSLKISKCMMSQFYPRMYYKYIIMGKYKYLLQHCLLKHCFIK